MKALFTFIFPSIRAIVAVLAFMFTMVSTAYIGIVSIARTEAKRIEEKVIAVRTADLMHLDKRLDRIEQLIKEAK